MSRNEIVRGDNLPALTESSTRQAMTAFCEAAERVQTELQNATGWAQQIAIAAGLQLMLDATTPEMVATLMSLAGSELGFKTDKPIDGTTGTLYPAAVVKACAIRATLHGAAITQNEFNIIAGGCYLTKSFYLRKLREFPGVGHIQIDSAKPEPLQKDEKQNWTMAVGGYASCLFEGVLIEVFAVENDKAGDTREIVEAWKADAGQAKGKAEKRLAKRLYERVTGIVYNEDDSDSTATVTVVDPQSIEQSQTDQKQPAIEQSQTDQKQLLWQNVTSYGEDVAHIGKLIGQAPRPEDRRALLKTAQEQADAGTMKRPAFDSLKRLAEFLGLPA